MKKVYEQAFFMKYYGSWSFTEYYSLPVGLRTFFSGMLKDQLEKEQDEVNKARNKNKR